MNIPSSWQGFPEKFKTRLGQKRSGRQRAMLSEGHLLLILHKPPTPGSPKREGVMFWRKPDGTWECSQGGSGLQKLEKHVESFAREEEKLMKEYEAAGSAEDYFKVLERATPLMHSAKSLHSAIQSAREAMPDDRALIDLRDWAYDIERTFELIHTSGGHALDFYIAKQSEVETRLSKKSIEIANRLNMIAAIFFPITAIASIFGMNLKSGLEDGPRFAFWFILLLGITIGIILSSWAINGSPFKYLASKNYK